MERWIPSEVPLAGIKRLLLDRLLFAPAFLSLFFLVMNFLEGQDTAAFAAKMKSGFWPALRMNWRVWTPVQFININYIPVQVRPASMEPQGPSSSPRAQPSSWALGSSQVPDSSWGFSLCPELLPLLDLRRQSDMGGPSWVHTVPLHPRLCSGF